MNDEIPLTGGRMTQGVVKKGNYVLRPCCINSVFVQEVLKWLETKSVSVAPRFVGLTDDGREIITYLSGVSPENLGTYKGNTQWKPTEDQLFETGKIIKILHTALIDFPGCMYGQTVCHNDLSPCNFMFENDLPYAVFDWDAAGIGDPLNDLAYAAWMWSDLGNEENSPVDIGKTINAILDAYELSSEKRFSFHERIHEQIRRVTKSLHEANLVHNSQWAHDVGQRFYTIQNQVIPYYVKCILPVSESNEERRARIYPVILSEYNPAWSEWFVEEKATLTRLIGEENICRILHIGSTAVPWLTAKPTVDIILEINETANLDKLISSVLLSPEYICLRQDDLTISTPPPHLRFIKGYLPDGFAEKVYHIHVVYSNDNDTQDKLLFRDYLITHPEAVTEYAELKRKLFKDYEHNRDGYTDAKGAFIKEIIGKASDLL